MKPTLLFALLSSAVLSTGAFAQAGESGSPAGGKQGASATSQGSAQGSGMQQSMSQDTVRKAQQALKEKGIEVGPIDGRYGPQTAQALRKFQQEEKLKVTGRLDQETLSALGVESSAAGAGGSGSSSGGSGGGSSGSSSGGSGAGASSGSSSSGGSTSGSSGSKDK